MTTIARHFPAVNHPGVELARMALEDDLRFAARYGTGPDGAGLVLECDRPRLTDADLAALHGGDCDEAAWEDERDDAYRTYDREYELWLIDQEMA